MPKNILIRRKYLDALMSLVDDPRMKAIMGPAFVGKTVLLNQFKGELLLHGFSETSIVSLSYNRAVVLVENADEFYGILEKACAGNPKVLLIDSIHVVPQYREAILKFHKTYPEISIYATASTSSLFDLDEVPGFEENVATIHLYPFTFKEFLQRYPGNPQEQFQKYLANGGFPFMTPDLDPADRAMMLEGFMHLVALKLVLRENKTNPKGMAALLAYLFANVSCCLTMKEVLAQSGIVDNRTLEKYINRIVESGILYRSVGYQMDRGMKESAKMTFFAADTLNGAFINLRGIQPTPWRNLVTNVLFTDLKARGYEPDTLMYKGEPVGMRIFIGDKPLLLRVDLSAEPDTQSNSFTAYRTTSMDKVLLTLDPTTPELKKYHHMNLVEFLMKEDLSELLDDEETSKKSE